MHPDITSINDVWQIELKRGLRAMAAGSLDEAESLLLRAYSRRPDNAEVCLALGRYRMQQERYAEAETLLSKAHARGPHLVSAAAALARCLGLGLDRFYEAHQVIDKALEQHSDEAALLIVRGELFVEEAQGDRAQDCFEKALAHLGSPEQASDQYRYAISCGLARSYNLKGIDLGRTGNTEEALFAFKRAADLDPEWSGPVVNMGVAFSQLGRQARALSCYERAIVREPDNPVAHFNLATLARDRGQLSLAEASFQAALHADAEYPGIRLALADVYLLTGNPTAAITTLREEMSLHPDDPDIWAQLANSYHAAGQLSNAETYFRGALALCGNHPDALCGLAQLLTDTGRLKEATPLIEKAEEIARQDAEGDPQQDADLPTVIFPEMEIPPPPPPLDLA